MKNYSTAVKGAIKNGNTVVSLIELYLAQSAIRITDSQRKKEWGGQTYVASGILIATGDIEHRQQLTVPTLEIQLSAADTTIPALFSTNQQGRRVVVRSVILGNDGQTVLGELLSTIYRINNYAQDEGVFNVSLSNHMVHWRKRKGLRTVQASHAQLHPNSTSFINSKAVQDDLVWGDW